MKIITITIGLILSSINLSHAITDTSRATAIILLIKGNPDNQEKFCSKANIFKKTIRADSGKLCENRINAALALEGCNTGKNKDGENTYFADFKESQCYDKAVALFKNSKNFTSNIETIANNLQASCEKVAAIIPSLKDECTKFIKPNPQSTASSNPQAYYKQTPKCIALLKDYPTKTDFDNLLRKIDPYKDCTHLLKINKLASGKNTTNLEDNLDDYAQCAEEAEEKIRLYNECLVEV